MNSSKTFSKAPITEAIFEIQVELPNDVTVDTLDQLCGKIELEYPIKKTRKRFSGKIELKEDGTPISESTDLGIDGFLNWSQDEKQVVQFRLDGFSFSRLKPYDGWDKHFPEVIRMWTLFSNSTSPIRIKRIAVRFVNVIEIPKDEAFQSYLTTYPRPQIENFVLNNFFDRIEFKIQDKEVGAIVTQALTHSNDPTKKSIILDIDVFKEIHSIINQNNISDVFEILHDVKNEIFKKYITEKSEGLFR